MPCGDMKEEGKERGRREEHAMMGKGKGEGNEGVEAQARVDGMERVSLHWREITEQPSKIIAK